MAVIKYGNNSILGKLNDATPEEWDGTVKMHCPPTFGESPIETAMRNSGIDRQVGGSHYKNYKIQPIEYTLANSLNFCQGNVIKYITRYKDKNGVEDLKKAKHYIDILISEYAKFEEEERKYEEDNGIY